MRHTCLVISCGALAKEIVTLQRQLGLDADAVTLQCLPAGFHNTPQKIAPAVEAILKERAADYDEIFVVYGECGTGGALDKVLHDYGASRLDGAHCYEFYAGSELFETITDKEIGSFFLTDYLVKNFDRLIIQGLGLDRFPHLRDEYFSNYTQVVYLSQIEDQAMLAKAKIAADRLGLKLTHVHVGYGDLVTRMASLAVPGDDAADSPARFEERDHVYC